ncbi:MAG TPA: xanthine dehydrogenase family protein subunit M [Fervidicoccus fontis]|uniref:Xanthine dehydrogenase family protein subunit M n=1 Tax=Fervidicoccus fontis TaxID=683846 RepID=A0A7C2URG6_9CREN|nr:MAG: xanthine dehydrogenase family protein subunit M [Fervidicoccus sp.]HEU97696.1 xanthine dehydrogenase family protein subunit M [Fervidicoccus fontis]
MYYRLPQFEYLRPNDLHQALETIREGDWKPLAGGTDLLLDMKNGRQSPKKIIDISRLSELRYVRTNDSRVLIGGGSRLQELLENVIVKEKLPLLSSAIYEMASWQIRNIATIAGNLCNASPAADSAPPLLVHGARVKLISSSGSRTVPLSEFFLGPRKTVLSNNELMGEIDVPLLEGYYYRYYKIGRRHAFTLSVVSMAIAVKIENGIFSDVRIAMGSVAPKPVRALNVEKELIGKEAKTVEITKAIDLVSEDISPISDVRASAEYRMKVTKFLLKESLQESLKYFWK